MPARFLADKSALARASEPEVEQRLGPLLLAGEIATCGIVDLEMLYSARNHREMTELLATRRAAYAQVPIEQGDFDRSIEVMEALSRSGQHRGVKIPDILIAAVAERARLTLLHYDSDFDRIARITDQPMEWIVPRGTVE